MKSRGDHEMQMNFQPSDYQLAGAGIPTEEHQTNPFTVLHRALRGRYAWAITLSVVLGAAGSIGGYFLKKPTYRSVGLVQIHSRIPKVLYTLEENQRLDMFDSVVSAETTYLQSPRVLTAAGSALDEQAKIQKNGLTDWPTGPDGVAKLQSELTVTHKRGEQIITVSVEDENPKLAMAGVNAVIDAYQKLYGDQSQQSKTTRESILSNRKGVLEGQIQVIEAKILGYISKFKTDDLDKLSDAELQNLLTINQHLSEIKDRLAAVEQIDQSPTGDDNSSGEEDTQELTEQFLSTVDDQLAGLIVSRNNLKATLDASRRDYGPSHYKIKKLERDIAGINSQINTRVEELRSLVTSGQLTLSDQQPILGVTDSVKSLMAIKDRYEVLRKESQDRLGSISETRQNILLFREQQAQKKRELESISRELDSINLENTFISKGRVTINHAELPNRPASDKRKQLAVLGGGGGVCVGLGLVWLFGVLRPSYRYIDELEGAHDLVILGTLPDLTKPQEDQKELAALSIHNLRNLLSLRSKNTRTQGGCNTYMITSARPGEGKTSLILALGMSFASEGCQTVLIDCDLVGRGLSKSLDMNGRPGLTDVLDRGRIDGEVNSTEITNLWMIPAGNPELRRPEELSLSGLAKVTEELKKNFDVILIDTGPLMGSLEANLAASVVDETILVVKRGQDPHVVRASLKRLEQLGGHCSGLVFNHALPRDLERSVSQVSFQSQSLRQAKENIPSVQNNNQSSGGQPGSIMLAKVLTETGEIDKFESK